MLTIEQRLRMLEKPNGPIDMVLDTDAYNEIDDQFAIAYTLRCPERLHLHALYAAPFHNARSESAEDGMEKSYNEILKLLRLANADVPTFRGSPVYLPDETTPVASPAAADLAERAAQYSPEHPLYVVAIGAITNVASAILYNPEIIDRIVIVWLGGHDKSWPDTKEFNLWQDVAAARVVFGCGAPVVQLPCMGVVSAFYTTQPELEFWLRGKNALCDYLIDHTVEEAESYAAGRVWSRVIWDVTAVGWLLNDGDRFMSSVLEPAPIPEFDGYYAYTTRNRPTIRRVTHINRDALFGELFRVLAQ